MRWRATIEIVSMLAAVVLFIWWVRAAWPWAWVMLFALIVASTPLNRDREGAAVGWKPAIVVVVAAAVILGFGRIRPISLEYALGGLVLYCLWGLVQQYILNAFFVRRLEVIAPRRALVSPAAAALFGVLHWPNPFLIAATFAGGWLASWFYLRRRGILFLGLAHGIVGTALYLAVPDDITHHLNVGPGYVALCRRLHGGIHLWLRPALVFRQSSDRPEVGGALGIAESPVPGRRPSAVTRLPRSGGAIPYTRGVGRNLGGVENRKAQIGKSS